MIQESIGTGVIYKYTSPSGKCYIGQTWHEYQRKKMHRNSRNGCNAFYLAIKKYGFESFKYEVLYSGISCQEVMDCLEIFEIENNNSMAPSGYNLRTGGSHGRHSKESIDKMSESRRKENLSDETRAKQKAARSRENLSKETLKKMRENQLGKKHSEETRAKMSESHKKENISLESRIKMSESHKGKKLSDSAKKKVSEARKNMTEATREKMRNNNIGKKHTEETKRKLSEIVKAYWAKKREASGNNKSDVLS